MFSYDKMMNKYFLKGSFVVIWEKMGGRKIESNKFSESCTDMASEA